MQRFVIYSHKHSKGGQVLWWNPGQAGYTQNLDRAGRYTEAEARGIVGHGETSAMIPESSLSRFAFPKVVNLDVDPNSAILADLVEKAAQFIKA